MFPVLCQFMLGVTEEQQDMIPPTTKSLRQRRCGHCLLQVRYWPCLHAVMWLLFQDVNTFSQVNTRATVRFLN